MKVQFLDMLHTKFEVSSSNSMAVREIIKGAQNTVIVWPAPQQQLSPAAVTPHTVGWPLRHFSHKTTCQPDNTLHQHKTANTTQHTTCQPDSNLDRQNGWTIQHTLTTQHSQYKTTRLLPVSKRATTWDNCASTRNCRISHDWSLRHRWTGFNVLTQNLATIASKPW